MTHLEKRSPMMEAEFDCETAEYKTVKLYDFVYKYHCFPAGWEEFLEEENVKKQIEFISGQLFKAVQPKNYFIEPAMPDMFKAFKVGRDQVKVVILGQDPTPQADKATGMAFSLKPNEDPRKVPSVLNMLVELKWEGIDVGLSNGDLTPWRNQGVLLLNAALTVRRGQAGSHQGLWTDFTAFLLQHISNKGPRSAWILWGGEAKVFAGLIDTSKHYIKTGGHPSPQGCAGFFGGNYFLCANQFLNEIVHRGGIDWRLAPAFVSPMEACNLPAE